MGVTSAIEAEGTLSARLVAGIDRLGNIRPSWGADQVRRARLLVELFVMALLSVPILAVLLFLSDAPINLYVFAVAAIGGYAVAVPLIRREKVNTAAIAVCLAQSAVIFLGALHLDGLAFLMSPVAVVVPIYAAYVTTPRAGLVFTGLAIVELVAANALHAQGLNFPWHLFPANSTVAVLQLTVTGALIVGMINWLHGKEHRRATQALELRTRQLSLANEGLLHEAKARVAAEGQLRHAQKLQALGTLSAGIAHEINNPLSFVISNLGALKDEVVELGAAIPQPRLTELLEIQGEALMGAMRIKRIVADIKSFARPDDEKLAAIDVSLALDQALRISAGQLPRPGMVAIDLAQIPRVLANEQALVQVFINLIVNAAQAVSARGTSGQIRVVGWLADDGRVMLEVTDNGEGMPLEVQQRAFEPFFTTKPIGQGTGLGLPICHGIITRLGGEISITSEVGKGTTITLKIPAVEAQRPTNRAA